MDVSTMLLKFLKYELNKSLYFVIMTQKSTDFLYCPTTSHLIPGLDKASFLVVAVYGVSHESGNPLETEGGLQLTPREEP
jgi:hypothetical protein